MGELKMENEGKPLSLYPIDYPFETLVNRVKNEKLILDPDFQRKYKWDDERASKFVESCLMRIPLPACYFAEDENSRHIVIDGVQRITSIKRFFDGEFRLSNLSYFKNLEGKYFSELSSLRFELESTTIRCIILRKENPKSLIQEIFARLNQGSVQLTAQEIRHALFPGPLDELLTELGNDPRIKDFALGENSKKEKDGREPEEQVLRFFALRNDLSDYNSRLEEYLNSYTEKYQNISRSEFAEMRDLFIATLEKATGVLGNDVFRNTSRERPKESIALYDLTMYEFSYYDSEKVLANRNEIQDAYKTLCDDEEFKRTMSGGLQQKASILKRRTLWEKYFEALDLSHD